MPQPPICEFLRHYCRTWGTLMSGSAGVIFGILGALSLFLDILLPSWAYWVMTVICLAVASYRSWSDQRSQIDTLQSRINTIEQARSQIKATGWKTYTRRIPTEKDRNSYEDAFFACVKFRNESSRSDDAAIAKQVSAHISYHDQTGRQMEPFDLGEWWPGLEPPLPTSVKQEEVISTEFGLGVWRVLSIAFKAQDGGCYGFCRHSLTRSGWRFKKLRLTEAEYTVKVTLRGINLPETTHVFLLKNPGSRYPLTLDYLVPDTGSWRLE